jgi:hypothetical protein
MIFWSPTAGKGNAQFSEVLIQMGYWRSEELTLTLNETAALV